MMDPKTPQMPILNPKISPIFREVESAFAPLPPKNEEAAQVHHNGISNRSWTTRNTTKLKSCNKRRRRGRPLRFSRQKRTIQGRTLLLLEFDTAQRTEVFNTCFCSPFFDAATTKSTFHQFLNSHHKFEIQGVHDAEIKFSLRKMSRRPT